MIEIKDLKCLTDENIEVELLEFLTDLILSLPFLIMGQNHEKKITLDSVV
jgi:hypothetical protein